MADEGITWDEFQQEFSRRATPIERAMFPGRSIAVLERASADAWALAGWTRDLKHGAIKEGEEEIANLLLTHQCLASAVASELDMWLGLRAGNPDLAWVKLVDAQDYLSIADRASGQPDGTDRLRKRMDLLESVLFPRQSFVSPGIRYKSGDCNICGERFDRCEHEEDVVYGGLLCREINRRGFQGYEVSFVDSPKDRRCRVTAIEDDEGMMVDTMTGERKPPAEADVVVEGRRVACIAYVAWTLRDV